MISPYIHNIFKHKKWSLSVLAIILVSLKYSTLLTFRLNMNYLTELHKCPACFGVSICGYIHKVDITLNDFSSAFAYIFGVKNVFYGSFNNDSVVLKKLAQSSELNKFDKVLCKHLNFSNTCTPSQEVDNEIDIKFRQLIENELSLDFEKDNLNRLRLCPSVKNLDNLFQYVYKNNKDIDPKVLDIHIWSLTVLNPEPLVLQILSTEKGWPVPKYFGACGRIVMEEYVGLPLSSYYNEPWFIRSKIAASLLDAAYLFTYKNENFGFYLTDISADNIAVDLKNNAKFVDLENVIVVDKSIIPLEESKSWNELHVNTEDFSCPECLAFAPIEICTHKISDHNYYAICKTLLALNINNSILPGGLLHDIPATILKNYPSIQHLIQQCVTPQMPFNRIKAGMQLKELLEVIAQRHE